MAWSLATILEGEKAIPCWLLVVLWSARDRLGAPRRPPRRSFLAPVVQHFTPEPFTLLLNFLFQPHDALAEIEQAGLTAIQGLHSFRSANESVDSLVANIADLHS